MKSSEKYTYSELNSKQEHFSLLCQGEQLGINLIKNVEEAGGGGGGPPALGAGFDQDANKCMTSMGIS